MIEFSVPQFPDDDNYGTQLAEYLRALTKKSISEYVECVNIYSGAWNTLCSQPILALVIIVHIF